jgi:membrane-bound ClpP family serine protease
VYLGLGLLIFPLSKRYPRHLGPSRELMEFLVLGAGTVGRFGILLAPALWALWPVAVIFGLFVPSLTLEHNLEAAAACRDGDDADWIGREAHCQSDLRPSGKIRVDGRLCDATCLKEFIPEGSRVRVLKRRGFSLVVERIRDPAGR